MRLFKLFIPFALFFFLYACSDQPVDKSEDALHPSLSELPEMIEESVQLPDQGIVPIKISPEDQKKADKAPEGMVFIKGGCFVMGNDYTQEDEKPEHKVCLSDFYMDKFEVTQARWEKVMGFNPSKFIGADLPVEQVNYENVRSLVVADPRIGPSHTNVPGHDGSLGFAGYCFPKDTCALRAFLQKNKLINNNNLREKYQKNSPPH